ncbi:MAG: ferrochelatase [Aliidongia sp.]
MPLYPQFSSTTTASSLLEWRQTAARIGLRAPETVICCYPTEPGFVASVVNRIHGGLEQLTAVAQDRPLRLLFSAHGLPQKVVDGGDPYQWQVEQSVAAVVAALGRRELDHVLCYQSRVGPLKWLSPSIDEEIRRAGARRQGAARRADRLRFPSIPRRWSSWISNNAIWQRSMACRLISRVPTVDALPGFIAGLAGEIRRALETGTTVGSAGGGRICPAQCGFCTFTKGE